MGISAGEPAGVAPGGDRIVVGRPRGSVSGRWRPRAAAAGPPRRRTRRTRSSPDVPAADGRASHDRTAGRRTQGLARRGGGASIDETQAGIPSAGPEQTGVTRRTPSRRWEQPPPRGRSGGHELRSSTRQRAPLYCDYASDVVVEPEPCLLQHRTPRPGALTRAFARAMCICCASVMRHLPQLDGGLWQALWQQQGSRRPVESASGGRPDACRAEAIPWATGLTTTCPSTFSEPTLADAQSPRGDGGCAVGVAASMGRRVGVDCDHAFASALAETVDSLLA